MGAFLYFGFCVVATVAILAGLSHYVIWPWAQWSTRVFGAWDLLVIAIVFVVAYPFIMRAERRAAIANGRPPPRHLWQRPPDAPPLPRLYRVAVGLYFLPVLIGFIAIAMNEF